MHKFTFGFGFSKAVTEQASITQLFWNKATAIQKSCVIDACDPQWTIE